MKLSERMTELIFKRKNGKWVFREPGYKVYGGFLRDGHDQCIETVPHQDFEYDTERDAIGHAQWYLNPAKQWFPPPPA